MNQYAGCVISEDVRSLGSTTRTATKASGESHRHWYALRVKSRQEFVVSDGLRRKGIEGFLPSVKILRQWKDRKKLVDVPLFPGYIFTRLNSGSMQNMEVLRTRGAVDFVSFCSGHPAHVEDEEIASLRLLVENREDLDIYGHLKEGCHVQVRKGPLKGAKGCLVKKEDRFIFVVNINLLGRSVGVRLYADDLEEA
jgi:transcription antitermination factor NusG